MSDAASSADSAPPVQVRSVRTVLSALADHSRGRRMAARSKRIFLSNLSVSIMVAGWTVLLSLPVIVWPLGEWIWDFGCHGLVARDCVARKGCLWQRTFFWEGSCVAKSCGYLSLWGTMLMQFIFSIYRDYGSTVKFTIQGAVGTALAWANMVFLNTLIGHWLARGHWIAGGAFRERVPVEGSVELVNSSWLPLCNDGRQSLSAEGSFCLLNVWWARLTLGGLVKTSFVWADFILYVVFCLTLGFDTNTRMFALSTHVYFMMAFVDPNKDDFNEWPPTSWNYLFMVMVASFAAVAAFRFPRRRFTALETAKELAQEAGPAVGLLIESMPSVTTELMRQKAASALAETRIVLADLEEKLASSWFEDFGWGETASERRELRRFCSCLQTCVRHVPSVHHAAAALRPDDLQVLGDDASALQEACVAARDLLVPQRATPAQLEGVQDKVHEAARNFPEHRARLSAEAHAFLFTIYGVLSETKLAVGKFSSAASIARPGIPLARLSHAERLLRAARTVRTRFGIKLFDRGATHPRFVVRNTYSICLAFAIGWVGLWNVLPAYSYYPSSTISVVLYTYTGSSAPLTVKRVAGVVLGKVLGTMIQLGFACESWKNALAFAASMFVTVCFMFFLYLHMDRDMAYVCCLTAAFAASCMIPGSFKLRQCDDQDFLQVAPALLNAIISTVTGVGLLSVVDLLLGSKATKQARQRLLRAIRGTKSLLAWLPRRTCRCKKTDFRAQLQDDLDALRDVLPYAAAEPTYWRPPFKLDLYATMEARLRVVSAHLETIAWAIKLLKTHPNGLSEHSDSVAQSRSSFGTSTALSRSVTVDFPGHTDQAFRPVFLRIQQQLRAMLNDVERLADAVTACSNAATTGEADDGATEVRRQLEANLYTVRAVHLVAAGAGAAASWARQALLREGHLAEEEVTPEQDAGARRCPELRARAWQLWNQVVHEQLRVEPPCTCTQDPGEAQEEDAATESVEELFQRLRAEAEPRERCALYPHFDDLCRVELIILLVNSTILEVGKMQLALLEY